MLSLLAQPSIAAAAGAAGSGGGPSFSMPALSGATGGTTHVSNQFTSGNFVVGQGKASSVASSLDWNTLILVGGAALVALFWFRK